MEPVTTSGALPLEHELLVQVLALASQKDRLASCALVSTAWHAAAVAASNKVVLSARTDDDLDSLLLYLHQHGAHVRSVFISKAPTAGYLSQLQSLPSSCSKLQELQISSCNLVNVPSVLSSLTSLTRLEMSDSSFSPAAPAGLVSLSQMTALQHLKCSLRPSKTMDVPFPAGVLSHLTSLTHLELAECRVDEPALTGVECLTSLRECLLGAPGGKPHYHSIVCMQELVTAEAVAAVSRLQQLSLLSITSAPTISSSTAPGLSSLTALMDLSVSKCTFLPAGLMGTMTALTRLHLQDDRFERDQLPQLLQVLPLLQQLEELSMHCVDAVMPLHPCYEDFAAFTASSKLRKLNCQLGSTDLPPSAFAAMFGGSKQLTALASLTFITNSFITPHQTRALGTTELQAIARSCPELKLLVARGCVQQDVDWSVFAQLKCPSGMDVSHRSDADAEKLASLVQLKWLGLSPPHSVTFLGIQKMTALTNLICLEVPSTDSMVPGWLYSKGGADHAPQGTPKEVWRQIQHDVDFFSSQVSCGRLSRPIGPLRSEERLAE